MSKPFQDKGAEGGEGGTKDTRLSEILAQSLIGIQ
jgi:hypothetical protein